MRTRLTWMILASGAVSPSRRHTRRPTIRTFRSACRSMRLEAATSIAVTPHWLSVRQQHLAAELNATPTRTSRMGISLGDLFTGTGEIIRRLVHYQIGRCLNLKGRHQIPQPMEYGCGRRRLGVIHTHGQPCWLKQFQPFSR